MQVGVAQVQIDRCILQCSVQLQRARMQRRDARMLLIPDRSECAAQTVLRHRQPLTHQPLPHRFQCGGFPPHGGQRLLQLPWPLRRVQALQHVAQPLPLRMAQRCLEAGLPFDVGEQGELQAPALHRRAPRQRRPGRDDFIDTQRAAQPVQAVPHRWIDLVGAALQPPLPAPRIHAVNAGAGIGAHRAWHHCGSGDAIGLLQDFAEMLRRSE
ncbi:hypothetical protein G6F65_016770 [Rhizopus arrhizus]|nr:hypothetical protein G6F65_016770 [Rhizopus arrhizus]